MSDYIRLSSSASPPTLSQDALDTSDDLTPFLDRPASATMGATKRIIKRLEAPHPENLTTAEMMLQNDDLLPVPPEHRTWQGRNYMSVPALS